MKTYMQRAVELAEKGRGRVSPNPLVGAVLVKNSRIVGEGYHRKFGGPHAEVNAIRSAGKKAKGATLYVTLEPCSTIGKTFPCTDAIIKAGIKKVVVGAVDPNPKHKWRGIKILKKAGIKVESGLLSEEVAEQNKTFFKLMKTGLPFVSLKLAQSVDGKIATRTGDSKWITSPESRKLAHLLRGSADAVLVGSGTVLADDPLLNVRAVKPARQPSRVILDRTLKVPHTKKIFKSRGGRVFVLTSKKNNSEKAVNYAKKRRANVVFVKEKNEKIDLRDALKTLGKLGIGSVLVEGGGETAAGIVERNLFDKAYFFVAPKIVGGRAATMSVSGKGVKNINDAVNLANVKVKPIGKDFLLEGEPVIASGND